MKFSLFNFDTRPDFNRSSRSAQEPNVITGAAIPQPYNTRISAETVRTLQRRMKEFEDVNDRMMRSYDAAAVTKYNVDFKGTFGSGNSEIMQSDYATRGRSRTIAKDTPQGKAVIRTFQNNVVGDDPFKLDMRYGVKTKVKDAKAGDHKTKFVEDEEVNSAIEEEWKIFGQPENFTNKMNMSRMEAFRIFEVSTVRDGFIIIRHLKGFPKNPYNYCIELLECDRLQTAYTGIAEESRNPIRFSIEYDRKWNYPVAYWVLTRHPGDSFGQSSMAGSLAPGNGYFYGQQPQFFRERIPAEDIILFNNLRDRAEQDIGFTELDASVQSLWRLFQYEKALTYAAISSCMKPYWIKKEFPTGIQFTPDQLEGYFDRVNNGIGNGTGFATTGTGDPENPVARQQGIYQRAGVEMPGSTWDLDYGLSLQQTDPKFPIEAAHEFRQDNQRDIAVATGTSYQDVSGDYQNLGFAAALMCQTPKQDNCKVRQRNFIDSSIRPLFREWLRSTILSGRFEEKHPESDISILKLEDYVQAANFKGKRWAFVNPLVQAQCLIILMEAGVMAPQQVQDQLPDGVSIETLYTMIAEAKAEQEKHGLNFENADVTRPTISKGEPGQTVPTPNEATPTPKPRPANPVRSRRARIAPETLDLIAQQGDGTYKNGAKH